MNDHISHGSPAALREFIAENVWLVAIQADLGWTYASIGDDKGLEYTLRRIVAYTRAALGTLADLQEAKRKEGELDER